MSFLRTYNSWESGPSYLVPEGPESHVIAGHPWGRKTLRPGTIVRKQMFEEDRDRRCVFPIGIIVWHAPDGPSLGARMGVLWSSDPDT